MNRRTILFSIAVLILLTPLFYSYGSYMQIKVSNRYAGEFEEAILETIGEGKPFDMNDVTSFEWDQMYVFKPYTSKEQMEQAVGTSWTKSTYFGYLLEQTALGEHPLDDESFNSIVFVRDGNVVLDITFSRGDVDLTQIAEVTDKNMSNFTVVNEHVVVYADEESLTNQTNSDSKEEW